MNEAITVERDLSALWRFLWRARADVLRGVGAFLLLALLLVHVLPRVYGASATVSPPMDQPQGGALSKLGFGGFDLSEITGADASDPSNSSFPAFLQALNSHELSERLQKKYHLLQLLHPDRWDEARQVWKPKDPLRQIASAVKQTITGRSSKEMDSYAVDDFIANHLSYERVPTTPFYTVSLTYSDREQAERILGMVLLSADEMVRDARLKRAEQKIRYLERKLGEVTLDQHKQALTALLIDEERTVMLAQSGVTFAFQAVRPVASSPDPVAPRWLVVFLVCAFLGAVVGAGAHWLRSKTGFAVSLHWRRLHRFWKSAVGKA